MLAIGAWLTPIDGPRLIIDFRAIERTCLPTFHRQLLKVGWKTLQLLLIGQHRDSFRSEEIVVPDSKQAHQDRQVPVEWRGTEVQVQGAVAG